MPIWPASTAGDGGGAAVNRFAHGFFAHFVAGSRLGTQGRPDMKPVTSPADSAEATWQ